MLSNRALLTDLTMVAVLLGLAVAGYRYSSLVVPKADVALQADMPCDLHRGPCSARLPGGGRLELAISPRPIPVIDDLLVEVRLEGIVARRVDVDFAGKSMNMGLNRTELVSVGRGLYAGKAALSVCVTGGMTWVATVTVETDSQRIGVPFEFDVGK